MKRALFLIFLLTTSSAFAEGAMRHVVVTPPAKTITPPEPDSKNAVVETKKETPPPKPLAKDKIFKKIEDTKPWPELSQAMMLRSPKDVEKILAAVKTAPEDVPPSALFMIAKALADTGQMEQAAFYYYAAQLRATVDTVRFPARAELPKVEPLKGKAPDQSQAVPTGPIKINNPHEGVNAISKIAGEKIGPWVMQDPARLEAVIKSVKQWDETTAYSYQPTYDTSSPQAFETWPDLLVTTRDDFFARLNQIVAALKTVERPSAPQNSFGH